MHVNERTKKIVIFSPHYPPYVGGLGSHAEEFNRHLSKHSFHITVFTSRLPANCKELDEFPSVKIIRFPAADIVSNYPIPKFWSTKFWQLYLSLFRDDYDIVISRIRFFPTSLLAMILAKLRKIKWIHIEHISNSTILSSQLKTFAAKLYDRSLGVLVLKTADLNVSISKAVQKFVEKYDKRFSPVVYRGLELDKLDLIDSDLEIRTIYKEKIVIVTAARLYKWKGLDYSLEAVRNLPQTVKDKIVFLIIGDGEDYSKLKKLSAKESSVVMTGSLPRDKVLAIMKSADIYIHSSMQGGGLSTSLLEAMYSSCAAIATPNEGASEVLQDGINGLIVEKPYSENIGRLIKYLVENRQRIPQLGQKARRTIASKFNWHDSIDLYRRILNNVSKPGK